MELLFAQSRLGFASQARGAEHCVFVSERGLFPGLIRPRRQSSVRSVASRSSAGGGQDHQRIQTLRRGDWRSVGSKVFKGHCRAEETRRHQAGKLVKSKPIL